MDRRHFIQSLLGGAAALATGGARADATFDAFEAARAGRPWTEAYVGLQADAEPMPLVLKGRLPRGLRGAFIRNGPARHALGGVRYQHWFDGDGLVQKYEIGTHAINHRGRLVRTEKFVADSKAGHPVRAAFGTPVPEAEPLTGPDSINVANTSVVHHGGELMALWEGGSAYRLDERTLDTRGPKVWSPEYAGMPFSAHPKIEPDGTLWNFGVFSLRSLLSIYRVKPGGELAQAVTIPVPKIAMVHDFAVTERHLVFLLPPLVFDAERARGGETFLDSHRWQPELGLRVLVLAKDRLDQPMWFELPTGFVFHLGNAWEDGSGVIRLDYMRAPDAWHATVGLKQIMQGRHVDHEYARLTQVEIDTRNGRARQTVLPLVSEFPRVDPRVVGRHHRALFVAERVDPGDRPGYDTVTRFDTTSGRADRYRYGSDVLVEEHVFVPRPGSTREGEGWLVGSALDVRRRQTLFSVFDAKNLAAGPLAQGTMARLMPLGLHAIFVPA
jgi:all-trans-8'-apo-beta-carotenal 15,15'-oxygenase